MNSKDHHAEGANTGKLVRFGVSADTRLLEKFDDMIVDKSYANRSEAIRDVIRDQWNMPGPPVPMKWPAP